MSGRTWLRNEEGMTLIELMAYSLLLVVVIAVAGGMIIASLRGQQTITQLSNSTSTGQDVAQSIVKGIRNSSSAAVTSGAAGTMLSARTGTFVAAGTATWQCRAWLYTTTTQQLWSTSSSAAITLPASATSLSGWSLIASNVTVPSGSPAVFARGSSSPFSVTLAMKVGVASGGGRPMLVNTVVTPQTLPTTTGSGPATC